MAVIRAEVISDDSNHAVVQNLRGWSIRGTVVLRLHQEGVRTNEVQDLVHDHTGGTFTISFNSETASDALQWDDDGSGIAAYLEALTYNGTAVEVSVVENATGDWTITYDAPIEDVPEIVVEDDSLTGGTTIDLTETTPGVYSGGIICVIENSQHEMFVDSLDARGGTWVEVVSGTLTEGYLWYV
jgi:hypothetical protein